VHISVIRGKVQAIFPFHWHDIFDSIPKPKNQYMPNEKTDRLGGATSNADQDRDLAGKEGPVTKSGNPDNKHTAPKPYSDDLQTQIAAKSNKDRNKETTETDKDQKNK
jgi:hypothetical protein